jgi:sulfopyruvate decarboxylase subunit alpha
MTVAPVIQELVAIDDGGDGISARVTPLSREEEAVGVMCAVSLGGGLERRFRSFSHNSA